MMHRGKPVDLMSIRRCALMAVEGEKDDISGVGQTLAALAAHAQPADRQEGLPSAEGVGHYGVFNGSRFRAEIAPRIAEFILTQEMVAAVDRRSPPRLRKVVG